jgi:malonyl CoA-acyl carrier protein transacylase
MGGTVIFAIEAFGTRVAMLQLSEGPPPVLLAGHLEGEVPVLVYRVADLEETVATLSQRGVEVVTRFGIPHGPGAELSIPGPQRIALYQLTRPEAPKRLAGRRDF